ncbi:FadR/GntR family transcriptional regulator [Variovorax ginsengisoli]|uniref:DNA-binding FadR family transcriptional regulator n=1 Tax=Variovorax ginsengisoli TaxID=363844 RepID=A0ABT9SB54_9BURK|nr:FadR/GntR family transcriptional regulator [Variovorax ginsengisoli]MDP9901585.1 DNA-binding FadR family transcriptional regulator [Variovorax ginsengisoli]
MPLQTVEPQRLYRQIAGQLRTLIAQGEFAAGDRLPAERDLAQQLGVSRPSVREALIAMEVEGWVEVRTGSGVYVLGRPAQAKASANAAPAAPAALDAAEWGPLELIRARRVIEGETAAIAALQGKRRHFDAMAAAIASMREMADRALMPLDGDRAFHVAIVEAGGNTVLTETVERFWDSRRGPVFTRLGGYFETVPSWRAAIAEHEAVYDAVVARDASAARQAMHAHMEKAHQRFSVSWRRARK